MKWDGSGPLLGWAQPPRACSFVVEHTAFKLRRARGKSGICSHSILNGSSAEMKPKANNRTMEEQTDKGSFFGKLARKHFALARRI